MKLLVIPRFHADNEALGTGAHVSERIRQVTAQHDVAMKVYVFGPAEQTLADRAQARHREALVGLAQTGVPVHVCRNDAERLGMVDEFTRMGFVLEYARDAFVRYAHDGGTVITF